MKLPPLNKSKNLETAHITCTLTMSSSYAWLLTIILIRMNFCFIVSCRTGKVSLDISCNGDSVNNLAAITKAVSSSEAVEHLFGYLEWKDVVFIGGY